MEQVWPGSLLAAVCGAGPCTCLVSSVLDTGPPVPAPWGKQISGVLDKQGDLRPHKLRQDMTVMQLAYKIVLLPL